MYIPGQGFTYLIEFGDRNHDVYLPEIKAVRHYEIRDSDGYDGKAYVQIAMRPDLGDPVLKKAVSGLSYRARRILFLWTAWLFGGGKPVRVMNVYAIQNVAYWFLLAALLLRWFPPIDFNNCFRWASVLFSFGLIFSVRSALLDGPSLFLLATGMALIECNWQWMGAVVLGISGLGKEPNILGGMGFEFPLLRNRQTWISWLSKEAIVLLPLGAWTFCLTLWIGHGSDIGARNLAAPFAGLANKIQDILSNLVAEDYPFPSVAKFDLLVLVGLLAQFFFFVFRMQWKDPWWRVGASYAVLMMFLGDGVWEGYPSASARVLLPMTLAFNIAVPRKGLWLILLVLGNIGAIGSIEFLRPPPERESFLVDGAPELAINVSNGDSVDVLFGTKNWYSPESSQYDFWRWSRGDSTVSVHNPQKFSIIAEINFRVRSIDDRDIVASIGGKDIWRSILKANEFEDVSIHKIELPPGDTILLFHSDRAATRSKMNLQRRVTFCLWDLEIALRGRR